MAKAARFGLGAPAGAAEAAGADADAAFPGVPPPQGSTGIAGLEVPQPVPMAAPVPVPPPVDPAGGQPLSMLAEAASQAQPPQPSQPALPLHPPTLPADQETKFVLPPDAYNGAAMAQGYPAPDTTPQQGADVLAQGGHAEGGDAAIHQGMAQGATGAGEVAPTRDDSMMAQQGSLPMPQSL